MHSRHLAVPRHASGVRDDVLPILGSELLDAAPERVRAEQQADVGLENDRMQLDREDHRETVRRVEHGKVQPHGVEDAQSECGGFAAEGHLPLLRRWVRSERCLRGGGVSRPCTSSVGPECARVSGSSVCFYLRASAYIRVYYYDSDVLNLSGYF